jgi:hypothetical protein
MNRRLLLAAVLANPLPAYAATGNFLPMIGSLFVVVPALMLAPVIAIGVSAQGAARKSRWVIATLVLALISYASLLWVVKVFSLLASSYWPCIYLWILPGFILWFAYRRANR